MSNTAYKFQLNLLIILVFTLSVACTSTKNAYKHLTSTPASLSYIQDSRRVELKLPISISLDSIQIPANAQSVAELKKTKSSATPLLFYNDWKYEFLYKIGSNSYQEDLSSFIKQSFINEADRSGVFLSGSNLMDSTDYNLSITVEETYAEGPMTTEGMFIYLIIAYNLSENQTAGPGQAISKFSYVLSKGGSLILKGSFQSERLTEPLQGVYSTNKKLRQDFNTSLVEATSFTVQENISKIVDELNAYFKEIEK